MVPATAQTMSFPPCARAVGTPPVTCAPLVQRPSAPVASSSSSSARLAQAKLLLLGALTSMAAPGIYARQAAECAPPEAEGQPVGWNADTALQIVASRRAREWRSQHGLLDDVDFAWAFRDHAEVVNAAGHHVVAEWLRIRTSDEQGLMHLASETVAAVRGKPASSSARPLRAVTRPYAKAKKRPGRSTGRAEAAPAPSALRRRVDALTKVFVQAGLARPSGRLSRALEGEWRDTCRRQAQIKASHAEEATVVRAS